MAPEQFPMFRLATLLARQLSSPVASRIKEYAKSHPRFGRRVCMQVAQLHRAAELRFKLWTMRQRQPRSVPPLADNEALNVGADILGEIIIFTLGSLIIIYEVNRLALKQEAKVKEEESRWVAAALQLQELSTELALQQADVERLHAALQRLAARRDRARTDNKSD